MKNILSPPVLFKFLEEHAGNRNAFILHIYLGNEKIAAVVGDKYTESIVLGNLETLVFAYAHNELLTPLHREILGFS